MPALLDATGLAPCFVGESPTPDIARARRGDRPTPLDRAQPDARVPVAMRIPSLDHLDGILGEVEPAASAGSAGQPEAEVLFRFSVRLLTWSFNPSGGRHAVGWRLRPAEWHTSSL